MRHRPVSLALLALSLAACATSDDRGAYGGDGGGRGGRAPLNVFVSPSGQPFRAARGAPYAVTLWFAGADQDHDGRLTRAEFSADAERFFHVLDANHDGVVDGVELQAYEQTVAPEILPRVEGLRAEEGEDSSLFRDAGANRGGRGRNTPGSPPNRRRAQAGDRRPEGAALYGLLNEPEPVAAADADFSGRITLEEWLTKTDGRFTLLDSQSRGYLSLSDLPKTVAQGLLDKAQQRDARRVRVKPR